MFQKLSNLYYNIKNYFSMLPEKVKNSLYWARAGWNVSPWNFDSAYYNMTYHCAKRIYDYSLTNGHLLWNENPNTKLMKRLREVIELCKILEEREGYLIGRNYDKLREKYEVKTGPDFWDRELNIKNNCERFFVNKAFEKDKKEYKFLKDRLALLIDKYGDRFWD